MHPVARTIRKPSKESMREQAVAAQSKAKKPRKLKATANTALKPVNKIAQIGKTELYIPLPDNKAGRFLNKRRSLVPKYFKESWKELRAVTWPSRKQTWQLAFAVFIFAVVFTLFVGVLDYGLDKIFRKVLLG